MEELDVDKSIIYYTDNQVEEPIFSIVLKQIKSIGLPIVSSSLKPVELMNNKIIDEKRGYVAMVKQILSALLRSDADIIFFCEHDVLYPKDHFDFIPKDPDIYYYNNNVWRWRYPTNHFINYRGLQSLSGLCVYRRKAVMHYSERLERIFNEGLDKIQSKEPGWVRRWGYEPGTKRTRRGGFSDEQHEKWWSKTPMIDIRHKNTYSMSKTTLAEFKHPPDLSTWKEVGFDGIKGWDLRKMFNL